MNFFWKTFFPSLIGAVGVGVISAKYWFPRISEFEERERELNEQKKVENLNKDVKTNLISK